MMYYHVQRDIKISSLDRHIADLDATLSDVGKTSKFYTDLKLKDESKIKELNGTIENLESVVKQTTAKLETALTDNKDLESKLVAKNDELKKARAHLRQFNVVENMKRIQQLVDLTRKQELEISHVKTEMSKVQHATANHVKKNSELSAEILVLEHSLATERKKIEVLERKRLRELDVHREADSNPFLGDVYSKKLKEKDAEIAKLSNRIKNMLQAEHLRKIKVVCVIVQVRDIPGHCLCS